MAASSVFGRLVVFLLFLPLLHFGSCYPTDISGNHTISLERRQCVFDKDKMDWVCDDEMPTLTDLVERLQNT